MDHSVSARARRGWLPLMLMWAAAAAWIAVLFFFSGQTGAQSGDLSLRVTRLILRAFPFIRASAEALDPVVRKLAHFGIFAVEGFLLGMAMMRTLRRVGLGVLLATPICAAMAVLNEYHESFIEGRTCSLRDMAIDSGGALAGILLAALICALLRARRKKRNVIIS